MSNSHETELNEFIALSKCLSSFYGDDSETTENLRQELSSAIMQRMKSLLDGMPTRKEEPKENGTSYIFDETGQYPPFTVRGDKKDLSYVLTSDVERDERALVADRVLHTIVKKLDAVAPDDAPGTMIELVPDPATEEFMIQAYTIPKSPDDKLRIFHYRLLLTAVE